MKNNALFVLGLAVLIVFIIVMSWVYFSAPDDFKSIDPGLVSGSEEFIITFYFYDVDYADDVSVITVSDDSDFQNASFDVITFNGNYSKEFSMMEQGFKYSMIVEKDFTDDSLYFLRFKD